MRQVTFGVLAAFALLLTMSAWAGMDTAQAQGSDGSLTAVCIASFETAPYVDYLTEEQISEIEAEWAARDRSNSPPSQIVGYPDPATGSCATEDGVLKEYNPVVYTPICVPSGPDRDGPLVVQWALTHYLRAIPDVILADPETGACLQEEIAGPVPGDSDNGVADDGNGAAEKLPTVGSGRMSENGSSAAPVAGASALLLAGVALFVRRTAIGRL